MTSRPIFAPLTLALALSAAPALASDNAEDEREGAEAAAAADADAQAQPETPPSPFLFAKPVFDETWATIGLGTGLVPSYAGSNDYISFPLPLIVGRVGGVGISPNGPGLVLDLNPGKPGLAPRKRARVAFGPAFRFRNDRNNRIADEVVARAGTLDAAWKWAPMPQSRSPMWSSLSTN